MYYHDHDLKKLGDLKAAAPEDFTAWANLDRIVSRENGKIPGSTASSSRWPSRTRPSARTASRST